MDSFGLPVKRRRKTKITPVRLMPSAGSGGSSMTRHHSGGGGSSSVSPGISDFGQTGGGHSSHGGAPSVTIPISTSSGGGGGGGSSYVSPSTVPASHAVTGASRTPALSPADQARIEAVQGLAKAQKQIAKLAKQAKPPKIPKPPKLHMLKQHPAKDIKLAKSLASQIKAPPKVKPGTTGHKLAEASLRLHSYAAAKLPKSPAPPKRAIAALPAKSPVVKAAVKQRAPQKVSGKKLDKTKAKPYVYPFSKGIAIGRTDMGIDPVGTGTVRAIGKAKVIGIGGSGWPDEQGTTGSGEGPVYKLLKGPLKGKKIYTYEGVQTNVQPGDILHKGEKFAKSTADFETGFAQGKKGGFQPIALKAGQPPLPADHENTKAGLKFASFVDKLSKGGVIKGNPGGTARVSAKVPTYVPKQYRGDVAHAAKKYKVPAGVLAAQLRQESGFDPNIGSPAGAQGIAQFMPGTASTAGPHGKPINPDNPAQAIDAQGRLMRANLDQFNGRMDLALAAYNAGAGAVEAAGNQVPDIAETQAYVKTILGAAGGGGATVSVPVSGGSFGGSTFSGTTTSGTTPTTVSGAPVASGSTSSTSSSNRARLLREVNKNRKKAASKIGTYRKGLTPVTSSGSRTTSSPSPSSGSITLGL